MMVAVVVTFQANLQIKLFLLHNNLFHWHTVYFKSVEQSLLFLRPIIVTKVWPIQMVFLGEKKICPPKRPLVFAKLEFTCTSLGTKNF